jgi:glycosyltransferase involved in cell wall biosynthesis
MVPKISRVDAFIRRAWELQLTSLRYPVILLDGFSVISDVKQVVPLFSASSDRDKTSSNGDKTPLVSVIICTYNRPDYLSKAISSVVGGTYANVEIIVSSNLDTAETRAVVQSFNDPRIRLRCNATNIGIAGNHLAAFAEMKGDLFAVLNDDDEWEPDLLTRLVPLVADDDVLVAFCDHYIIDGQGKIDEHQTEVNTRRWRRDSLAAGIHKPFFRIGLVQQSIPIVMGAVIKTRAIDFTDFPLAAGPHFDLWMTYLAGKTGKGAYYLPARLVRYRVHPSAQTGSTSPENSAATKYIYSRLLKDPELREYYAVFRGRYAQAQVAHALALLRQGSAREARSELAAAMHEKFNARVAFALMLSFLGTGIARVAMTTYARLRQFANRTIVLDD